MIKVPTVIELWSGFGKLAQLAWDFSLDFLPVAQICLLSSDIKMNVQACSRCGYGVYPAEKISCLDQVSGHFSAFGNNNQYGRFIFLQRDMQGFLNHQKKMYLSSFFSSTHFYLCLLCFFGKKKRLFIHLTYYSHVCVYVYVYYHVISKDPFLPGNT